jgi:hypothetical protein
MVLPLRYHEVEIKMKVVDVDDSTSIRSLKEEGRIPEWGSVHPAYPMEQRI